MIITEDKLVIEGYVARDKGSTLYLYEIEPKRTVTFDGGWLPKAAGGRILRIPGEAFPNLKWENEPIKVELTIKRIQ